MCQSFQQMCSKISSLLLSVCGSTLYVGVNQKWLPYAHRSIIHKNARFYSAIYVYHSFSAVLQVKEMFKICTNPNYISEFPISKIAELFYFFLLLFISLLLTSITPKQLNI